VNGQDVVDDLRMFLFVEAQARLDHAVKAKDAADAERIAAENAMQDAFARLTLAEQDRVNDAYRAVVAS
jgi:hypothetical protein